MPFGRWRVLSVGLVLAILAIWAARVDVPKLAGPIKGDEATYVAMAFSLAKDGDLKYRPEDYRRFVSLYGTGPEGVFLKRSYDLRWRLRPSWPPIGIEKTAVPATRELDYGKPFAYAAAAAPFAAIFGLGGLLLFNILLLIVCLWCAVAFGRARAGRVAGTLIGAGFIGASVAPVYGVWLTSEVLNFSLVLVAYFLWLYKEVAPHTAPRWLRSSATNFAAAALLGIATFSKVIPAPLMAPLVLVACRRGRWRHGVELVIVFCIVAAGLFGINALVSGEANYQGGDRASFATHFPYDKDRTPFDTGSPMSTNEANDENILAPGFLLPTLKHNLLYFFAGRDAGLLPYFFPGVLILGLWLARLRRSTDWQAATAVCCMLAALGLLVFAPGVWNGGGGPIGNRYFLTLYPVLLFLVPAGTSAVAAVMAIAVGLVCVGPILARPFANSRVEAIWMNPERWPLRLLPIEFTLINQLPVALDRQRGRVQVSVDPEVFLYYMDSRTYFQEPDGFWVAPGTTDIVIRTARPLTGLELRFRSPIANAVDVSLDGRSAHVTLQNGRESTVHLRPEPGVYAVTSYQLVLELTTAAGFHPRDIDPASTDSRHLGVFVTPTYETK